MNGVRVEELRCELGYVLLGIIIGQCSDTPRASVSVSKHAFTGTPCDGVAQEFLSSDGMEQVCMAAWLKRYGVTPSKEIVKTIADTVNEWGRAVERRRILSLHGTGGLIESKGGYTRSWSTQLQKLLKEIDDEAQEQANDQQGGSGELRPYEHGEYGGMAF